MPLTLQIPDSPPIFPVTLEDGFIQRRRKLCPRSQRFTRIQDTLENSPNLLLRDFMRIYLGLSFPWIYVDWMKQFINHKVGVHIKSTISISYHHHHQHHHHHCHHHHHHHHHHTERWGSKSNLPVASPRFRIPSPGFHSFCWNTFLLQNKSSLRFLEVHGKWISKLCLYLERDFILSVEIPFLFKTTPDGELSIFGTAIPQGKLTNYILSLF